MINAIKMELIKKYTAASLLLILFTFGWNTDMKAQDGEALFTANCAACHKPEQDLIGPALKGARQRWEDAGEGDLIYDWIKNPPQLMESGKSSRAAAVWEFNASNMTPQALDNKQIDAILDWADNYVAPVDAGPEPGTASEPKVITKPNYAYNQTIFYVMLGVMAVLLIVIIAIARTIMNVVTSDYYRNNFKGRSSGDKPIRGAAGIIALLFMLTTSNASALSFNHQADSWVQITNTELWIMALINITLLGIAFRMFISLKNVLREVSSDKVIEASEKEVKNITQILTDTVAVEDEASILLDHDYDGIQELDNNLPPWWKWGFYISIVFAFVYLGYFHVFGAGDLQGEAYEKEMQLAEEQIKAYLEKAAMNIDESNVQRLTDAATLDAGAQVFKANCVTCHLENGSGKIGPNLTDKYWLYGNDITSVFSTIKHGTSKGMPEHESKLNPAQLQNVANFVLSLNYAEGKQPEGDLYEETAEAKPATKEVTDSIP